MLPEALVRAARGFYEVFEPFSGFLNGTRKTTKVHKMNSRGSHNFQKAMDNLNLRPVAYCKYHTHLEKKKNALVLISTSAAEGTTTLELRKPIRTYGNHS